MHAGLTSQQPRADYALEAEGERGEGAVGLVALAGANRGAPVPRVMQKA